MRPRTNSLDKVSVGARNVGLRRGIGTFGRQRHCRFAASNEASQLEMSVSIALRGRELKPSQRLLDICRNIVHIVADEVGTPGHGLRASIALAASARPECECISCIRGQSTDSVAKTFAQKQVGLARIVRVGGGAQPAHCLCTVINRHCRPGRGTLVTQFSFILGGARVLR